MTTRYYGETPCGTCRGTGWIPDDPEGWDVPDMSMSGCPDCQPGIGGTGGGQRRELTDIEIVEAEWDGHGRTYLPFSGSSAGRYLIAPLDV